MRFSERNGFAQIHAVPITSRLEASEELRGVVVNTALDSGFKPDRVRELLCRMLQKRPDSNNWSPGNVESEVRVSHPKSSCAVRPGIYALPGQAHRSPSGVGPRACQPASLERRGVRGGQQAGPNRMGDRCPTHKI